MGFFVFGGGSSNLIKSFSGSTIFGGDNNEILESPFSTIFGGLTNKDPHVRTLTWDSVFRPVRQPEWWQGDSEYHAPAYDDVASELERRLKAGEFVVTSEVAPPQTVAIKKLCENVNMIKPYAAAINFTDSPSATPRMSSWACSAMAIQNGAEPVMQIAARDRTSTGLQAEVLGAAALGGRNILCLSVAMLEYLLV